MSEWRLFEGDCAPFSTVEFFRDHPWVPPSVQAGHAQRTEMVANLIRDVVAACSPASLTDLGCGDGSLLHALRDLPLKMWGYDAGVANVEMAKRKGLDVREGDILRGRLPMGEMVSCCEVLEHLAAPRHFLRWLPSRLLVVSSPSAETGEWHYPDHAWAWDLDGYARVVRDGGWYVVEHVECDGGTNNHGGVERPQRFQAIFAVRHAL